MSFYISVLTNISINLVGVLSIFLITGMTGLFSLGQASFMAIGAYAAGLLVKSFAIPFPVAALAAIAIGTLFGYLVGLPTIRLRRDYIALITFGFGEAIIAVLNNFSNITGGAMGLMGIPRKVDLPIALGSVIVIAFITWNFKKSRFGRQCLALKTDELAAASMGIDVNRTKMLAFLLASAVTSYAGVLYGFYTTYVDPTIFTWTRSAEWLIAVFFGGLNSLTGALISGLILGVLPELLRGFSQWRIIIYCIIVLFTINFRPQGLFGNYEFSIRRLFDGITNAFKRLGKFFAQKMEEK